jgi:hypothetical protein
MKDMVTRDDDDNVSSFTRKIIKTFISLTIIFIVTIVFGIISMNRISDVMYKTYINQTREIIHSQKDIEDANSWERLPVNERKEKLRSRYYEIIKYYTNEVPQNQKMNDDQMLTSFNAYYNAVYGINSVNFFLPLAYLKARTNFNPTFNDGYQIGIASLFVKEGADIANLPVVKELPAFQVAYKGAETLQNPVESLKLLIARLDDLLKTFNNREDWAILSLLNHSEYDIIAKYWQDGKGEIPEKLYKDGPLANTLDYYYAFKNWKISSK